MPNPGIHKSYWIAIGLILTLLGVWGQALAKPTALCPDADDPMPAALHKVVTEAQRLAEGGEAEKAIESLSRYLTQNPVPAHPYPFYELGYLYHGAGRFDQAINPLEKALKINPCFMEAWQLMATVCRESGHLKRAAKAMERATSLSGKTEMQFHTAVLWIEAGKAKKAIPLLERLLTHKKPSPQWFVAMANAHQALKQPAQAAQYMAEAAKLDHNPEYRYQAALLWLEAERPKEALPLLQELTKAKSPQPEWLVALSNTLKALKKKVETARAMEKAARASKDPDLMFHAAWLWLEADRPQNALPLLQALAQKKKPKIDWLLALCNTYMTLNRITEAAGVMDRVIAREAKPAYLYNGGALWLQADRPSKALPHLLKLSRLPSPKPDWLVGLAHAWIQLKEIAKAADAMERAATISGKPDHVYQAGVLRLQLKQADKALGLLRPLARHGHPKADWLVAISNACILKSLYGEAATAMQRAAAISGKVNHLFRAAQLWLQDERPRKALPLLEQLVNRSSPKGTWLITLSNTHLMLDAIVPAAHAMERAAGITRKGEHYHRAAMLWRQAENIPQTIALLEICTGMQPVQQAWLVDLASILIESEREKEAAAVMARTSLVTASIPDRMRYKGALLWLNLRHAQNALPILEQLGRRPKPRYKWMVSLVKTYVEVNRIPKAEKALQRLLDRFPEKPAAWDLAVWVALQQSDYAGAAAVMEVARRLDPAESDRVRELSRLYHMAGVPVKAARAFRETWRSNPAPADWDHLVDIYLSGRRYDLAIEPAREAVKLEETAKRWEAVGDIAYQLYRYKESYEAYQYAATLSDAGEIRLKAGYALMKSDHLAKAGGYFREALDRSPQNSTIAKEAHLYLTYIDHLQKTK